MVLSLTTCTQSLPLICSPSWRKKKIWAPTNSRSFPSGQAHHRGYCFATATDKSSQSSQAPRFHSSFMQCSLCLKSDSQTKCSQKRKEPVQKLKFGMGWMRDSMGVFQRHLHFGFLFDEPTATFTPNSQCTEITVKETD